MKKNLCSILGMLAVVLAFPATSQLAQQEKVALQIDKGKVVFSINGQQAATYHTEGYSKPILFPVYAPGQVPMTRSYPMIKDVPGETTDHPHHQSVWFTHGDVIPKGVELKHKLKNVVGVDFWSLAANHGKIICTSVKPGKKGSNWASIDTTNEWRTADGMKIMDEKRTVSLYDFGKARLWVFDVDLHASVYPIIFGDTKEGAMALRVNDTMNEKGTGTMQNAEGKKKEKEVWGHRSAWVDYSGTVDGKKAGIAILDHPNNPPSSWHARGYGLLAANPFGREKARFPGAKDDPKLIELAKGKHLKLRYGVLVHEGTTEEINMQEYYDRFLQIGGKGKKQ